MTPEIGFLGATSYNWPTFRATMDKVLNLRPDIDINAVPINFSDDALILLNIAAYYGWDIRNPLETLRCIPTLFMEYLSYQLFIACDTNTWEDFNPTGITAIKKELTPEDTLLIIASGTLSAWHQTITNNLCRDWQFTHETRYLFCRIMLLLERDRGLGFIFEKYKKKLQTDYTFLLELK